MTWFRRTVAAGRVFRFVALLVFSGVGPGLHPVLARTVDFRGADARDATANGHPRGARLIGLAPAEGLTSFPLAAPLLRAESFSSVREDVSWSPAQACPVYRYRSSEGPSALSRLRLLTGTAQQSEAARDTTATKPFYRKTWFLAGAAGLTVATAILLASGGGDDGRPPILGESLPGFPPPPKLLRSDCVPIGANGHSR
jgi:hypothetical protein